MTTSRPYSFWRQVGYALAGLALLAQKHRHFQIHLLIAALAVLISLILGQSPIEWAVLTLTIALVLSTEAVNSAIEAAVDCAVGEEQHPIAKAAKDMAAGACLLSAFFAVLIGICLWLPKVWARF